MKPELAEALVPPLVVCSIAFIIVSTALPWLTLEGQIFFRGAMNILDFTEDLPTPTPAPGPEITIEITAYDGVHREGEMSEKWGVSLYCPLMVGEASSSTDARTYALATAFGRVGLLIHWILWNSLLILFYAVNIPKLNCLQRIANPAILFLLLNASFLIVTALLRPLALCEGAYNILDVHSAQWSWPGPLAAAGGFVTILIAFGFTISAWRRAKHEQQEAEDELNNS